MTKHLKWFENHRAIAFNEDTQKYEVIRKAWNNEDWVQFECDTLDEAMAWNYKHSGKEV